MGAISLRLPDELEAQLTREAEAEGCPKSELARRALTEWLAEQEKKRFIDQMVAEAKALYAAPTRLAETREVAKEGLDDWLDSIERDERAAGTDPEVKWWD